MNYSSLKGRFTADKKLILTSFLVLTLLVFFFVPAVIFNGNDEFISGQYLALLPYSSLAWLLTFGLFVVVILMMPNKTCKYIAPLASYLALSFFVMGIYLTPIIVDVGLIDDRAEALELESSYIVVEILVTICLLIGFYIYYPKIRKVTQDTLSILLLVIVGFSAYVAYTDNSHSKVQTADREEFFKLSEDENVLVFLFDTFSSDFLMALLDEDPTLAERLDGFTFFRDIVSVSPTT